MARQQTAGTCQLCRGTFGKTAMTRHLQKCLASSGAAASLRASKTRGRLLHLAVQGKYTSAYWLHVEVPAAATFGDLDNFLRAIWLECCGHCSAFHLKKAVKRPARSASPARESFLSSLPWEMDDIAPDSPSMENHLGAALQVGETFAYEYDFGSTTDLTLRIVSEREGPIPKQQPVRLLARNDPPVISCGVCGERATQVCALCSDNESGWLCRSCAKKHECGEEMFLPVVNSPRTGVCGYTGN